MKISVVKEILSANDQVAAENHELLSEAGVFVVNLMASPGAGKTSLILATARCLPSELRPGVIEGDLASTIDSDTIAARGLPVVQINTGGNCHLDAPMIRSALPHLPLAEIDLLFIENVGNLVCPAGYDLGEGLRVVLMSVTEGEDKPLKYPTIFHGADLAVITKADLAEAVEFDWAAAMKSIQGVRPGLPTLRVSAKTGEGMDEWLRTLAELHQLARR